MKFIDGVWRTAEGMNVATLHHVFDMATGGNEVAIEASTCPKRARFEDQDTVYLTVRLFSPAPNVIGVRLEHFRGLPSATPAFAIASDPAASPGIVDEPDFVSLTSGDLAVRVEKRGDWRLDVRRAGRRITGSAPPGAAGYATDEESGRGYMFERLDLGVGDLVYGLGERFAAFVKNGQSVEIWNRDGGTSTDQAYKNVPFFMSTRGFGTFINSSSLTIHQVGHPHQTSSSFEVKGDSLDLFLFLGPSSRP